MSACLTNLADKFSRQRRPAATVPNAVPLLERYVTNRRLADDVRVHANVLGEGSYAKVCSATCLRTGEKLAVKTLRRTNMSAKAWQGVQNEARIHLSMDHPHIVRLHRVYDEGSTMHLVMERLEGGELFYRLRDRRQFSEEEASDVACQVLSAVAYMHFQGVVHRDIKLENVMYVAKDSPRVKLIDLGFACRLNDRQRLRTTCGTLQYMAPEVVTKSYNEKVDVWSVGSMVYTMLTGQSLFMGADEEVFRKTTAGRPDFSDRYFGLSKSAKDFIALLLATNPSRRLSASEADKHAWLCDFACARAAAATSAAAATVDDRCRVACGSSSDLPGEQSCGSTRIGSLLDMIVAKMAAGDDSSCRSQIWAGCWAPLARLLLSGH